MDFQIRISSSKKLIICLFSSPFDFRITDFHSLRKHPVRRCTAELQKAVVTEILLRAYWENASSTERKRYPNAFRRDEASGGEGK